MKRLLMLSCLILNIFSPTQAMACAFPISLNEKVTKSDTIFTGKLESLGCKNEAIKMRFSTDTFWKGTEQETIDVIWKYCDNAKHLTEGDTYLIYAKEKAGMMSLYDDNNFCSHAITHSRPKWREFFSNIYYAWKFNMLYKLAFGDLKFSYSKDEITELDNYFKIGRLFSQAPQTLNFPYMYEIDDELFLVANEGMETGLFVANLSEGTKTKVSNVHNRSVYMTTSEGSKILVLNDARCKRGRCNGEYEAFAITGNEQIYSNHLIYTLYDGLDGGCGRESLNIDTAIDSVKLSYSPNKINLSYNEYDCSSDSLTETKEDVSLSEDAIKKWKLVYPTLPSTQ